MGQAFGALLRLLVGSGTGKLLNHQELANASDGLTSS